MRRAIALIVMFIIPLQFAWSAAAALHGHPADNLALLGIHAHAHDHHETRDAAGTSDENHNQDGHHDHYHPVFTYMLVESGLMLDELLPDGPILNPPAAFFTRTPPLLDRPPLARA